MSGDTDKDSKTEVASDKKIADALEKGNVPVSREISIFASLLATLVVLTFFAAQQVSVLTSQISLLIDDPGGVVLESGDDVTLLLWSVGGEVARFLVPAVAVLAVAGLAAALFQNSPSLVLERIRPQWNRVSPLAGWKRIFSSQGQVEFLKAIFKFVAISVTCLVLLHADAAAVLNAMYSDPVLLPALVLSLAARVISVVCVATIVLVAADLVWSRVKWRKDLMMTKQEVKDEFKQSEGDPVVKARLRSIAKDRTRRRMITAVPRATLVIANPTHYAIALRYDRQQGGAPVVVAKGADLIALRIRGIAEEHGIPVIEDKPLARAMYEAVEVDQWIPPEFYQAIAKILFFLYAHKSHVTARS